MKQVKIAVPPTKTRLSRATLNKIVKALIASVPRIKPTKEEVEAARQSIRKHLIRDGYTKKEAIRLTSRKKFY